MAGKKQLLSISQLTEKGDGALKPDNSEFSLEKETTEVEEPKREIKRGRIKRRKKQTFKKSLEEILSMIIAPSTVAEAVKSTPLGDKITYQEAILISQVLKASNGDTQASTFIRDTSGNKLKERVDSDYLKLEDLL